MAADYEIVNIKELEDMAVKFGLSPHVEARFGRSATDAKQGGFSYQKLAPDFRQPFGHKHENQEEIYVVLGGLGQHHARGRDRRPEAVRRRARRAEGGRAVSRPARTGSSSSPSAPARVATPRCSRASGRTRRPANPAPPYDLGFLPRARARLMS